MQPTDLSLTHKAGVETWAADPTPQSNKHTNDDEEVLLGKPDPVRRMAVPPESGPLTGATLLTAGLL